MGMFSWFTQDTNKSISNKYSCKGTFPVNMINPNTGEVFHEEEYEGYGVFGGKDYYELMAELNGLKTREDGISLQFSPEGNKATYPILVENVDGWEKYKGHIPFDCPEQGYFYDEWEMEEDDD